jgi:hypothetical protein
MTVRMLQDKCQVCIRKGNRRFPFDFNRLAIFAQGGLSTPSASADYAQDEKGT